MSVYSLKALHSLCQRINGKIRTPKIEALHRLIHFVNEYNKFERLDLLSLDYSNLLSNAAFLSKLIELKNSMNTKRNYFNWGHL